jgi:DNA-binding protein HU-beta
MTSINKSHLTELVAERQGITKTEAKRWVDGVLSGMSEQLAKGNELRLLPDLGIFKMTERSARTGRNPQSGATIQIAAKKDVKFSAASSIVSSLNK